MIMASALHACLLQKPFQDSQLSQVCAAFQVCMPKCRRYTSGVKIFSEKIACV